MSNNNAEAESSQSNKPIGMTASYYLTSSKDSREIFTKTWNVASEQPKAIVFFIHGLGEHISRYDTVFPLLSQAGIKVIGFDLRGHGKTLEKNGTAGSGSKGNIESLEAIFSDIEDLWKKEWNESAPRFVMGHSMGGLLALLYAFQCPHKLSGVILSAPAFKPGTPIPSAKLIFGEFFAAIAPSVRVNNGLNLSNLSRDPAVIEAYKVDPLVHSKISLGTAQLLLDQGKAAFARGADVKWRLLIAHGTADILTDYGSSKQFAESVPVGCTFKSYEGYFHELHNEPKEFKEKVMNDYIEWIGESFNK